MKTVVDSFAKQKERLAALLERLGHDGDTAAQDLLDWYNSAEPDWNDAKLLAKLYHAGRFRAWNCPTCDDRVYEGTPEDWGDFQGVCQVDYASYPEGSREQCDYCRCHHPQTMRGKR